MLPEEKGRSETSHSRGSLDSLLNLTFLGLTLSNYAKKKKKTMVQPRVIGTSFSFPFPQAEEETRAELPVPSAITLWGLAWFFHKGRLYSPNSLVCWEWGMQSHLEVMHGLGNCSRVPQSRPSFRFASTGNSTLKVLFRSVSPWDQHDLHTSHFHSLTAKDIFCTLGISLVIQIREHSGPSWVLPLLQGPSSQPTLCFYVLCSPMGLFIYLLGILWRNQSHGSLNLLGLSAR